MIVTLTANPSLDRTVELAGALEPGAVRTNLTIVDAAGVTTKVNEPGPVLDAEAQARLIEVTAEASMGADWLVLAGSLPPGVADDFYVRVVDAVRAAARGAGASAAPEVSAAMRGAGAPARRAPARTASTTRT